MNIQTCFYNSEQTCEFYHDFENEESTHNSDIKKKKTNKKEYVELTERVDALSVENTKKDESIHNLELEILEKDNIIDDLNNKHAMYYNDLKNDHETYRQQAEVKYNSL